MRVFASGAFAMAAAVALGAFGAHGLKRVVEPELLATWKTAVDYHMVHAIGLCLLGLAVQRTPELRRCIPWFVAGTTVFSGSLYLLVLTGVKALGAITPVGGACLIVGWALAGWSALRASSTATVDSAR
ncbi:MAG: DUF423 domain-containing protein [Armatimonadota bacterium]